MKLKKSVAIAAAMMLSLSVFCSVGASALSEIWPHKTQFTYTSSNPAWLSDLSVCEQPNAIKAATNPNQIIAKPARYAYVHTPDSFQAEVAQYMRLYELDENSYRAAYVYVLEALNKVSAPMYADVSDAYIKQWLESAGIVYPAGQNEETLLFARALYTVMQSNPKFAASIPSGTKLEAAVVAYIGNAFGANLGDLAKWDSSANFDTLQKYVIAVSKAGLHAKGYVVDANTSDEAVFKMMAVMVIENAGYVIDADTASFEELKVKYMAAMLGKAYDVRLSPELLDSAIKNDSVPFYLLQAMGQKKNITVKNNTSYTEAFNLIAEKTDYFNLEHNEFYSDVLQYDVYFEYIRSYFWLWPQTLMKTNEKTGQTVKIYVDGKEIQDGPGNKIAIRKTVASQTYAIKVVYTKGTDTSSETYKLTVYQGDTFDPKEPTTTPGGSTGGLDTSVTLPVIDAITDLLNGSGTTAGTVTGSITMPERIKQIIDRLTPSFGSNASTPFDFLTGLLDFVSLDSLVSSDKGETALGGIGGVSVGLGGNETSQSTAGIGSNVFANAGSSSPLSFGSSLTGSTPEPATPGVTPYRHINEMAAAPDGYTYITDSNGYVLGLAMKYDAAAPGLGASGTQSGLGAAFSETFKTYSWLVIPVAVSALGIAVVLIRKRKQTSSAA